MPIDRRCLVALLLLAPLALTALAAPASAQEGPLRISATPGTANVTAGDSATFLVNVSSSDRVFERTVDLAMDKLPAGWTFNFSKARLAVPANGWNHTTLLVVPPADVQPQGPLNFTFTATDPNALAGEPVAHTVFVNVLARPESPPSAPQQPAGPRLSLSAADASGTPGARADGTLTLVNEGEREIAVDLRLEGAADWAPNLTSRFVRLHPELGPRTVGLTVRIPAAAADGETRTFVVRALAEGVETTTTWTVTALGQAAPAPTGGTGGSSTATTGGSGTPSGEPAQPPQPNLQMDLDTAMLEVAPGQDVATQVRLSNTGDTPLVLRLTGATPATWTPPAFAEERVALEPGQTRLVAMTVRAPQGVPPGGVGVGTAAATTDDGLLRQVSFTVRIVEGAALPPSDPGQTPGATLRTDEGAPISLPGQWGVAAGVATVGAGALALARRPWREKLVWGAAGLYTRLARPDVLGHDERERLYRLVETRPGIHFHALQRELGWNTGTLTYHLRVLERHGFVVSRRDGLYRRFYLAGAAPRKETFTDGPTGLRADVLEAVRGQHGMSQTDLALALGANKQTVNYHVKALERAGMIRVEKRGRETFLYPAAPGAEGPDAARA